MLSKKNAIKAKEFQRFSSILEVLPQVVIEVLEELKTFTENYFITLDWWGAGDGNVVVVNIRGYHCSRIASTILVEGERIISISNKTVSQFIGYWENPKEAAHYIMGALNASWELEQKELERRIRQIESMLK